MNDKNKKMKKFQKINNLTMMIFNNKFVKVPNKYSPKFHS